MDIVEVGTQLRNIPASRLYEDCGFRLVASNLSLRKWIDGRRGSRGARELGSRGAKGRGERRREGDEVTRRKGNKKSGGRLYQGARSQACPEPRRRAHIPRVITVEAPDHPIRHLQASIGQWQVKQQVAIFLRL